MLIEKKRLSVESMKEEVKISVKKVQCKYVGYILGKTFGSGIICGSTISTTSDAIAVAVAVATTSSPIATTTDNVVDTPKI